LLNFSAELDRENAHSVLAESAYDVLRRRLMRFRIQQDVGRKKTVLHIPSVFVAPPPLMGVTYWNVTKIFDVRKQWTVASVD